jgi:hypothetical protein
MVFTAPQLHAIISPREAQPEERSVQTMPRSTPAPVAQQSEARVRFVRAVNTRVNNALLEIAKIGKLCSQRYEYTQDDIEQIMRALESELSQVREMLETRGRRIERRTIITE